MTPDQKWREKRGKKIVCRKKIEKYLKKKERVTPNEKKWKQRLK